MDIPPIGGIRTFPLGSAMRADGAAPRFEIGASTRAGDEKYSPSRQTPDRGSEDDQTSEGEEQPAEELTSAAEENDPGTQINVVA
jgi:hypothetical protein